MTPDILERMYATADQMKEQDDNLLKAIAMLAASGHMTIVPGSMQFGSRPVIMLPDRMYQRMEELFPAKPPAPSPHPDHHRV